MIKVDPRVIKTRNKLREAFLDLLKTHRLSQINVKDVTNSARVTRGTFYLHFKDKTEFVHVMMENLIEEFFNALTTQSKKPSSLLSDDLLDAQPTAEYPIIYLQNAFDFAEQHPTLINVLLSEEARPYFLMIKNKLGELMQEYMSFQEKSNKKYPEDLLYSYLTYTLIGGLNSWLKEGKIYAKGYMAQNMYDILQSNMIHDLHLTDFFQIS